MTHITHKERILNTYQAEQIKFATDITNIKSTEDEQAYLNLISHNLKNSFRITLVSQKNNLDNLSMSDTTLLLAISSKPNFWYKNSADIIEKLSLTEQNFFYWL